MRRHTRGAGRCGADWRRGGGGGRVGGRLTRASAWGTIRSARSSSGWSTTDAMVERIRAAEGDRGRFSESANTRRINDGLYQQKLMLFLPTAACQSFAGKPLAPSAAPCQRPVHVYTELYGSVSTSFRRFVRRPVRRDTARRARTADAVGRVDHATRRPPRHDAP